MWLLMEASALKQQKSGQAIGGLTGLSFAELESEPIVPDCLNCSTNQVYCLKGTLSKIICLNIYMSPNMS